MNLRRSSFHLKWCLLPSRPNVWSATTSWPTTATTSTSQSVERSVAEARVHDCDAAGDAATTKSVWASHRLVRPKRKSGWRKTPRRSKRFAFSETFYSSSNASRVTICQRRHVWRSVKCVTCVTICGWEMSLLSPKGIEAFFWWLDFLSLSGLFLTLARIFHFKSLVGSSQICLLFLKKRKLIKWV